MIKHHLKIIFLIGLMGFFSHQSFAQNFEVQKIAKDVYALIRKEPPSLWFNPNNVFIIGKKDVMVVDSNISSEYTKEVLAALRKITKKPVKYVINTHWHEDHIIGNHVYRDAFPDVQFIGQRSTLTDLPTIGASNRKGSIENGAGFVKLLKSQIAKGENLAGQKLTEEESLGYAGDIKLVESYLAESPGFQIILPTILVDNSLELTQDSRKIEILFLGRAHTGADIVVRLPKENIVICGDLIVYPVPLVGSTSYPLEYGATLEKLLALNARIIIPGHGPVMRDDSYLKLMIRLLNSIKSQVEAAAERGETLEQARKSVNLEEFRQLFAGDSQHKRFIFQNYVTFPAVTAAYNQAKKPAVKSDESKDVSEIPDKLFAAIKEKNADAIRNLFLPEGQLIAIDKPRNGQGLSKTRTFTVDSFAKTIAEGKGDYVEKMPLKEVKIYGDLATVTGRYTFYVGENFSHCGTNTFNLVRTEAGWKIANAASTLEFQCDQLKK